MIFYMLILVQFATCILVCSMRRATLRKDYPFYAFLLFFHLLEVFAMDYIGV